ncbi:MAG: hypothetical protein ABF384_14105 [Verrucomicrobiales bacterium]|jgi:arylsulfatase A
MATIANCELPDDAADDSHDLLSLLKGEANSVRTTHIYNTYSDVYVMVTES